MRIGIDIFSFDKPGENYGVGPGVYVWHLLPALFRIGHSHQFFIFANKDNILLIPKASNVTIICSPFPNKLRAFRIIHEQLCITYWQIKHKLDGLHCLGNNIPFLSARNSILTVYDLMWKYYYDIPEHRSLKYRYFALTVPLSIRKARAVITISEYVAEQVRKEFNLRASSIFPIHLASGALLQVSKQTETELKGRYCFPFIFTVTTAFPHKNLQLLLATFCSMKSKSAFDGKLVVAGQLKGEFHRRTIEYIVRSGLENDVMLRGFISEEEKAFCYRHALLFVYPSLYEGFGLPVLEAMEAGVPVLASNAASIPEVGSAACIYFEPSSAIDLEKKMISLLKDKKCREALTEKGFKQSAKFSWDRTAEQTLKIYEEVFNAQ